MDEATEYLKQVQAQAQALPAVSVITQMDLIVGCRNQRELRAMDKFLSRFEVLELNEQISDTAIDLLRRYRLNHGLLIADALIAATALSKKESFVTKNQRVTSL